MVLIQCHYDCGLTIAFFYSLQVFKCGIKVAGSENICVTSYKVDPYGPSNLRKPRYTIQKKIKYFWLKVEIVAPQMTSSLRD